MPYTIRSYEGQDDWGNDKWLAHMNLGSHIYMSFFGPTKEAAETRARDWYEKERKRLGKQDTSEKKWSEDDWIKTDPKPVDNAGWGNAQPISNDDWGQPKIHALAGKVWMVNRATNHKTRIDPSEVDSYIANGYVRGGPRS